MDVPADLAKKLSLQATRENPEYAQALAKRAVLRGRLREVEARIATLQTQLTLAAMPLDTSEFSERVAQAVASKDGSFEPVLDIAAARLELSRLKSDKAVLAAALREQSRICNDICDTLSLAALKKIEAEHRRAVAAIAQAMDDLRAAAQTEAAIRRQFREAGYSAELPNFRVPPMNLYRDNWGVGDFAARVEEYLR